MKKLCCATKESALRQRNIEECLVELMRHMPYSQISVSSLCQQAGVSRTAFYRYFENKDACLASLLKRDVLETSIPALGPGSPEALYPDMLRCVQAWKRRAGLLDLLVRNGLSDRLVQQTSQHLLLEENALLGQRPQNPQNGKSYVQQWLLFGLTGFFALIVQWHTEGYIRTEEEMAGIFSRIISRIFG